MIAALPLCALLAATALPDAPADDLAADARAAYEKTLRGELQAAEELYQSVIDRGGETADLYFNLGTVQLERGHLVPAITSFERALDRDPAHADAQTNLRAARARAGALPDERAPSLRDALPFLASVGSQVWAGVFAIGNALWVLGALLRRARPWAWALGLALVVGSGAAMATLAWGDGREKAVALEATSLRSGPAERYDEVGGLPPGASVEITERREGWVEVRAVDGRRGWVPLAQIQPL